MVEGALVRIILPALGEDELEVANVFLELKAHAVLDAVSVEDKGLDRFQALLVTPFIVILLVHALVKRSQFLL